ncbi:MAG: HPF/RaiA family ribosome-associated protein [Verrucomicrobia bacterium]|nr:HPF/RaiA family ribosome-associated protein [Verrucomicrobiota bacterium]
MKIQFRIREMQDDDGMRRQLEADLEDLNRLLPVASAHVALERQRDVTPPYQAAVMLAVPGPDIHAAARDHTWLAAWRKVVTRLREQIEERRSRQTDRQKNQPHIHRPAGRRAK